jgi:hypothetical protein
LVARAKPEAVAPRRQLLAAELMSTANRDGELYDDGDSGVFRFSFETRSEAEALDLKLAHFSKKYGNIVMLQHPLP